MRTVFTQRNFVADLPDKCNFRQKWPFCIFEPPFGGLGTTYDVHLRLIGKHIENFILMITELLSLGVTAEALRVNID